MKPTIALWVAACLAWLLPVGASAEVKVVWNRNQAGAASGQFTFQNVPKPSATDAATTAKFVVVGGRADPNGGDLDVLCDGRVPSGADQPDANFFFAPATDGGRLMIDLGQTRDVKRINTYSWHLGLRGPQVYRLHAHDGSAASFRGAPGKDTDLVAAGWKLLASVDTRPGEGEPGGQYGVSVFDTAGTLGAYRYLVLDVARTRATDRFANTFYSEIDVDDGNRHVAPASQDIAEFIFDTSEMPELKPWVEAKLRPVCRQWYPRIVEMLASEGFSAPLRVRVTFEKDMRGVASTGGARVHCAGDWFKKNLEGEASGAVVHELVHVVQQYGPAPKAHPNPGWLVEGIADYIRWFKYEPKASRPRPDPARAKYTDSYRVTAAFLNYVTETHDKDIVKKLNAAMRQGNYSPDLWKTCTGKSVDELWADYVKTLGG